MLNILLVCKRLKEEKAHMYIFFYTQFTLQTLTDTTQIQDDPPPVDFISSL